MNRVLILVKVCVREQCQYDAPLGWPAGQQGHERQLSVAVHSIWEALYLFTVGHRLSELIGTRYSSDIQIFG